jgi:uncharacterized paraquat-inducible protein A
MEAETALQAAYSLHWNQSGWYFNDFWTSEVGKLPVEQFTVVGSCAPCHWAEQGTCTRCREYLQLRDQQGTRNQQVQDEHPIS